MVAVTPNTKTEDVNVQAELLKLIKLAKTNCLEIDRDHGLYRGGSNHAIRYPYERGERAILDTLRVKLGEDDPRIHPAKLWPRRYTKNGARMPLGTLRKNYRRLEPQSPRQKIAEV